MRVSSTLILAILVFLAAVSGTEANPAQENTVSTQTTDGVVIYGDRYYGDLDATAPLILLFHQGGSNGRAEYAPLTNWLNDAGYRAIAWDQRSGGDLYGETNRTADGLPDGSNLGYCDAYPDLQAALDFVLSNGEAEKVIVWGSSYSAALVFRLAAENVGKVSGVLAFSPASGGPMVSCRARQWADNVQVPAKVFKPASEMTRETAEEQRQILERAGVTFTVVEKGIHGSSLLIDSRTENEMSATRAEVIAWLDDLGTVAGIDPKRTLVHRNSCDRGLALARQKKQ